MAAIVFAQLVFLAAIRATRDPNLLGAVSNFDTCDLLVDSVAMAFRLLVAKF